MTRRRMNAIAAVCLVIIAAALCGIVLAQATFLRP
jgi:hypothetical protein